MSRFACIASLVTTAPSSGSGASSGRKWLISFALPDLATLSCAITMPGVWVTAASRWTFLFPPALAPLRSLPSTATACRAGTCPRSPVTAGSSHGCSGCGRNQPSSRSWRKLPAAGAFCFRFFSFFPSSFCRFAAAAAVTCGSSAASASAPVRAASSSSASRPSGTRYSVRADGATRSPVAGLTRQPWAASSSWSQPAAAPAIASGPRYPHAAPATSTDTTGASSWRIPRLFRRSVSRAASARRSAPGSGASPPPRWRRTASISDDASTGAALHGDVSDG